MDFELTIVTCCPRVARGVGLINRLDNQEQAEESLARDSLFAYDVRGYWSSVVELRIICNRYSGTGRTGYYRCL